ncbi:Long-chain fatty acid transport protein 4 [Armadillidium vulgare]|nr:Long-chain fatty acid transport protein 4 [Armadillidium vulgare]
MNNNLRLKSLKHCIAIVNSISIITSQEGQVAFEEIKDEVGELKVYVSGSKSTSDLTYPGGIDLDKELKDSSTASPPEINNVKFSDKMVYIYTSGTTGLPKAAVIKHSRCYLTAIASYVMIGFKESDIIYCPLPLYHMAAGIQSACQALCAGVTVVLRPKFSATNYWKDCVKYKVTSIFFLFPNIRCYLTAIASNIMIGFKESDILYCPLPLYHMAAGIQASGQALCAGVTVVLRPKFSASNYWKDCIKAIFAACGMYYLTGVTPEDTLYDPLPMYHTVGGIIGPGMCLVQGTSVAIRRKFSASNYWKDCIKYNCTVKFMFGNGLRPQIWEQFQERFNVKRICEFYGATEGNANIINIDGKPGAIGFVSVLIPSVYPVALIKIDEDTGKPLRDENGLCHLCKPGEPGEFVGRIVRNDPIRDFHGYADKQATESKIVRDVWAKGDAAFLSGDILVMDEEGYLYFKDRRGDTFRWKGENVSTTEVEGIISQVVQLTDVVVYGVEVPGAEGRAGMAAIMDPEKKVDLEKLAAGVQKCLPGYAQPLFIRIVTKLDMTGTYKLKKVNLRNEGFDITRVEDDLYFLNAKKGVYEPLTKDIYSKLNSGEIRV